MNPLKAYWLVLFISGVCFFVTKNDDWAIATLRTMTVEQKIGQLFVIAVASDVNRVPTDTPYIVTPEYIEQMIKQYHVGGLLFLYKSIPEKQRICFNHYNTMSAIPLWVMQDCEYGLGMRLDTVLSFPKAIALGVIQDEELIYQIGKEIGYQCKGMGIDVNLAPVADVNTNALNPVIGMRSFGERKENVVRCAVPFMKGMQDAGVFVCAKHFPGHGDTHDDSHHSLPIVMHDKKRLQDIELYPFKKLIEQKVNAVMTGHLLVQAYDRDKCASLSKKVIQDLLQKELAFDGLVITDGLGMKALPDNEPGMREMEALLAGNDILLAPVAVPAAVEKIKKALREGCFTIAELDRKVLKVLRAKQSLGVHIRTTIAPVSHTLFHSEHAYALKKKAYHHALTLIGGADGFSSIDPTKPIVLVQVGKRDSLAPFALLCSQLGASVRSIIYNNDFVLPDEKEINEQQIIVAFLGMGSHVKNRYNIPSELVEWCQTVKKSGKKMVILLFGTPVCRRIVQRMR